MPFFGSRCFASYNMATASASSWLSPAVLHMVQTLSLEPSSIRGTGKSGRLTKGDVLMAIRAGTAKKAGPPAQAPKPSAAAVSKMEAPAAAAVSTGGRGRRTHTDIPLTNMRKVIASRLSESKQNIPHSYHNTAVCMDGLTALRAKLKAAGGHVGSVNDFVIRAVALALRDVPEANVQFDANKSSVKQMSSVDVSVAVATPAGLITPIIKAADRKGIAAVSATMKDLATRAKDSKLKPEEFIGGTFTISNLGMFGIDSFSAVINPPQACILAVSGSTQQTFVNPEGQPETRTMMTVSLSCDARAVDGEAAGRWLTRFREYMEDPVSMLL